MPKSTVDFFTLINVGSENVKKETMKREYIKNLIYWALPANKQTNSLKS